MAVKDYTIQKLMQTDDAFFFFSSSTLQAALKQLTKNKVPNMAVLLKSITHTHADAKAVFKDPTGSGSTRALSCF